MLGTELTVATIFPEVAPLGTEATICVALQLVIVDAWVPLNVIVLAPWVAPKLVPEMVTEAPKPAALGETLVIVGVGITVKLTPLLATPESVTTTLPVVAPFGTGATMLVALQLVGVADVPLKLTLLFPCVAPKFAPAMVTLVPAGPVVGDTLVIVGAGTTVKLTPLLASPDTVTTTFPVLAPLGTGTEILVELQLVGVAVAPLNVTVLLPCEVPKFVPVIVTGAVTGPDDGDRPVMAGEGMTVKFTPLLASPETVTTTLPVVAPVGTGTTMLVAVQVVGVAEVPLNVTLLVPWVAPKFVPVIVIDAPTPPDVGDRAEMFGKVPPPVEVTETLSKVAV